MSGTNALENQYRFAIRAYPSRWRAKHGEELLGVMLDVAASRNRSKASAVEMLHLMTHGLTARVNQVLSVVPRRRRDRLAAAGLIAGTALALVMMVLGEISRWFRLSSYTFADDPFGPVTTPAALVFLATMAAFITQASCRYGTAKLLHACVILLSILLAIIMKTADPTIVVPLAVFATFIATSSLALLGNPTRTDLLRRTVLVGAPALGILMTLNAYLQGIGSQKTFWRPSDYSIVAIMDSYGLSRTALELMTIATLIIISGTKLRPWACLLLVPLTSLPISRTFVMLGGDPQSGLIGVRPEVFYILCTAAALISAWAAWKRPIITFPTDNRRSTSN